jgi:maleylpyruvate isomerase
VRLYSYWRSSSAWRVRIALAYKRIAHELVPVHLLRDGGQQHLPAFIAVNPLAQVPVLELDAPGTDAHQPPARISQSMAIIEYLDERFPTPPLLPIDPIQRAHVRQLAEAINSGIQPMQNMSVQQALRARGLEPLAIVSGFVRSGLAALEAESRAGAGAFLFGDAPTLADVYLVPQLYAARRVGVDVDGFPLLRRVETACEALPAFQAAHPDAQPDREPAA